MSWQHQFPSKFLIKLKEKTMNEENLNFWTNARVDDPEIPDWKALDIVIRKWVALSGFEKDQNSYQKMKEMYQ
jgi:hypothetical protein